MGGRKPKMVSERYLGSAADITAALYAREPAVRPGRTRRTWGVRLGFVGSIPPARCPGLLARPAADRHLVDPDRIPGLTAFHGRRQVFSIARRVVLTHSVTLHAAQSRGFDQTLAKAAAKLAALTRGNTRRPRDDTACPDLEEQIFGKRVLMTDRDHWPTADVVAGYRSQSETEFGFRQLKKPPRRVVHPRCTTPTERNIRVHVCTCVLAFADRPPHAQPDPPTRPAPLDARAARHRHRHRGNRADLPFYRRPTQGPPHAHRDHPPTQDHLAEIFELHCWVPTFGS
ncbi:MAG: hypothetical protein ACRDRH_01780 [Pseudonocardia sp.]